MSEVEPASTRLTKELGLFDVYAISTGAMFSSGFFLLPGLAAAQTGPSAPLAYLVAGLFILPALLSVAELSTAMPRAGGAYYFLDRSMGPLVGTVGGLGTWMALVLKSAFALVGMGAYLALFVDVPMKPVAVALTVLFAVINIVGAKETSGLQRILVTALLAILAFFTIQGLVEIGSRGFGAVTVERFTPFAPFGLQGFMATVGLVFVSYAGLTKVASVSEEVRDPDRNIPLGMFLSLLTASFMYTVGVYIIIAVLEPSELRSDLTPVATAAAAFFDWLPGDLGVILIVIAATAAFASTGNAGILSASRYPLAMARDRLVSERFGTLGRFHTPTLAIVATAGFMIAAILLLDVAGIAKLASAFQLLLFAFLNLAVIIMRESHIEGYDPGFRSPLYPWVQVVGMLAPLWLISEMGELAVAFTLGLLTLTIAWYFLYGRERVERRGAILHTFARLGTGRYGGLDLELRGIVKEKGLREEDPFNMLVASAAILEYSSPAGFPELVGLASSVLSRQTDLDADLVRIGFEKEIRAGFMPIAHGVALPHLRLHGVERPTLLLVRTKEGMPAPQTEENVTPEKVHAILFLLSPKDDTGQHLRLLGHLATEAEDPDFIERWCNAETEQDLKATLLREERLLSVRVSPDHPTAAWVGHALRDLDLPDNTLVALIRRASDWVVPGGSTVVEEHDQVTLIGSAEAIRHLTDRLCGPPEVGST